MDFVTRQFIVLAKKLRDEFRKARETLHNDLSRLTDGLKNLKDAISTQGQTNQKQPEINPRITATDFQTQVPIRVQTEAKRSTPERVWRFIKGAFEIAGIVAVITYTIIAYQQWQESTDATNFSARQAELSRKGLNETVKQFRTAQRAWIGVLAELYPQPNSAPNIAWRARWANSGPTPALDAQIEPGWMYQKRSYLVESDFRQGSQKRLNPGYKGSHAVIMPNSGGTTPGYFLADAPLPGKYLFLIVTITYSDIFGHTHTTRSCQRLDHNSLSDCNIQNSID